MKQNKPIKTSRKKKSKVIKVSKNCKVWSRKVWKSIELLFISIEEFADFFTFVSRAGIVTIFGSKIVIIVTRNTIHCTQNVQTLRPYIFHTFRHSVAKFYNFTHFTVLCPATTFFRPDIFSPTRIKVVTKLQTNCQRVFNY